METFEEVIQENEDLTELRRLRGTKKASVTRANTYIQNLTTNLEELDIAELQRRYSNLLMFITHYEIIAKRISELEKKDFDHEDDTDPQLEENRVVLKLYSNRISA